MEAFEMKYTRFEWWLPKLLCLIAACALWVYVMNEQNPQVENTYTVPVETRNLDRSLVATNVPSTVKVKVRMARSDMIYMRSDNIKAYVDLSGMTDGDYPNTPILVSVPGDESVVSVSPKTFDLNIDTYAVKTLPANVQIFGTPETNFSVESNKATPDTITIAGSSTMVAKADRAVVSVNIAGKEKSFAEFDSVNILDADGNTVTGLDIMPSQVKVTVKMKEETKLGNLPIKIETKGEPAKGYKVGKITVTPPVATLTAPISFFAANRTLDLDPIDVTGASSDIHQVVNVNVPSGGSVAVPKVTVDVEIDKD
jgi:YbbR domain-containing protein